jgi:hypothetical protein
MVLRPQALQGERAIVNSSFKNESQGQMGLATSLTSARDFKETERV